MNGKEKRIENFKEFLKKFNYEDKVAVILPCYKTKSYVIEVVKECLKYVDLVICIDDFCPLNTGQFLKDNFKTNKVKVINHKNNKGVGAAFKTGVKFASENGIEVVIKIDSDGQMDPKYIPLLSSIVIRGESCICKGNRLSRVEDLVLMPKVRLIGNILLSYISKMTTGYWEIFDPTNGFFAYRINTLRLSELEKTNNRYFFETDLLFRCSLENTYIEQIPMPAKYGNEISSLKPLKSIPFFVKKHLEVFIKRTIYQYLIMDFNSGSVQLISGILAFSGFLIVGLFSLVKSYLSKEFSSPGTVGVFIILGIISLQFLLAFINFDTNQRMFHRKFYGIKKKNNNI